MLSHVPAGLGVLESMLLLLLPDVPPEQLLAAVLHVPRDLRDHSGADRARALGRATRASRDDGVRAAADATGRRAARPPTRELSVARPARQADHRQERVSERCGRSRRRPRRAARCTSRRRHRRHFLVDQARQAERLLDQRVAPAMRVAGAPAAAARGRWLSANSCSSRRAASVRIDLEVLARPCRRGVHHPALRSARGRSGLLESQAAQMIGPVVQRRASAPASIGGSNANIAGPARRHPHVGEVTGTQRPCGPSSVSACGAGTATATASKITVLPAGVGLQFPAALARDAVRARRRRSGCRRCARAVAPARSCPAGRSTSPRSARATRGRPP